MDTQEAQAPAKVMWFYNDVWSPWCKDGYIKLVVTMRFSTCMPEDKDCNYRLHCVRLANNELAKKLIKMTTKEAIAQCGAFDVDALNAINILMPPGTELVQYSWRGD